MTEESNFREIVQASFKKVKEDMLRLENMIVLLKSEIEALSASSKEESSIGNKGVLSKQASKQAIKQLSNQALVKQSEALKGFNEDIEAHFRGLTKQEFMVFLSLYQLEEERGPVSFKDLAESMKLSEGCIRAYIYKLLAKGTPIMRDKVNNRFVNLSVFPEFRAMNLKKRLTDLYYELDASQKRLFDNF